MLCSFYNKSYPDTSSSSVVCLFFFTLTNRQKEYSMNAVRRTSHDPSVRLDVVDRLTTHLLQYPQDIVDTKHLMKRFQASPQEFQQALLNSQQEEERSVFPSVFHAPSRRLGMVYKLVAHLLRHPQDIVDTKY